MYETRHCILVSKDLKVLFYCSILRLLEDAKVILVASQFNAAQDPKGETWGCSSAGRAPALHAGGQEFDPPHLHQVG